MMDKRMDSDNFTHTIFHGFNSLPDPIKVKTITQNR